jgi:hypothetical protein
LFSDLAQFRFDATRDFDCVTGWLLINLEKNRIVTIGGHADPLRLGRVFNRGYIVEQHHTIGRGTQHGVLDFIEFFKTRVGNDEVKLVVLFQATDCNENI